MCYDDDPQPVVTSEFKYRDGELSDFVEFDVLGVPRRSTTDQPLESGEITLSLGARERRLEVRPNGTVAWP